MFQGIFTALISPFKYGAFDFAAFEKMVSWQVASGVHGLVIAGTTGEGQSLTQEEFLKAMEVAVNIADKKVKIIANTGLISTLDSIELTQAAQGIGVDGVMLIAPYYIRPTQEGIYQHFKAIHDLTSLPIILYDNPFRTCVNIENATLLKLFELERIVAIKDCSANILRAIELRQEQCEIPLLCGDDILSIPSYSQGAVGLVSVVSNIVPSLVVSMYEYWRAGKLNEALELQEIIFPLNNALRCETNPVPVKYAASQFELCLPDVRLPLAPLSERNKKLIREALQSLKSNLYAGE